MFVVGDRVMFSATDLVRGARCEFALLRALDAELGTLPVGEMVPGATGFGDCAPPDTASGHEAFDRLLTAIRGRHGAAVVELPRPGATTDPSHAPATLSTAAVAALRAEAPAVVGAVLCDGDFFARADLSTRTATGVRLHGAAAGRDDLVATALRLSACADLLAALSVPVDPLLYLYIGPETLTIALADAQPVYRARRLRTERILDEHSTELLPVQWGDPRFRACGHCAVCLAACAEARDLLLVAGMDIATRTRLRAAGITSIDRLATRTTTLPGMPVQTLTRLRSQALAQLRQEHSGRGELLPADVAALDMLPPAAPGDLALHTSPVAPDLLRIEVVSRETILLTCEFPVEPAAGRISHESRTALRETTRRAFTDLLAALTEPLLADPGLHVYHYTGVARTLLLHTSGRLGFGEEAVDALLHKGTLVDLYPIVRGAFVIGTRSYDLCEIAPVLGSPPDATQGHTVLWLADRLRSEAAASTAPVPDARTGSLDILLRDTPPARSSSTEAALAEYAVRPAPTESPGRAGWRAEPEYEDSPADSHRVAALTAALLGYHRREQQRSWWAHIDRLTHPLPEWPPRHGVLVADSCVVDTNWHIGPGEAVRRFLSCTGRLAGAGLAPGTTVYILYDPVRRAPRAIRTVGTATVLGCSVNVDLTDTVRLEETLAPESAPHDELPVALSPALPGTPDTAADALEDIGEQLLVTLPAVPETALFDLITRTSPRLHPTTSPPEFAAHPAPRPGSDPAIGPSTGPGPGTVEESTPGCTAPDTQESECAASGAREPGTAKSELPALGGHAAAVPWSSRRGAPESTHPRRFDPGADPATALAAALRALDCSYLGVQAPTGTGRTTVLAAVLAELVTRDNWRIGIVAPTAAPVENLLDAIVRAGVLPELVAKSDAAAVAPEWLVLDSARYPRFLENAIRGCVLGGTAGDFTDPARVPRDALDLLVIADANTFSLAATAAVSVSARNLLITGDPAERHHPVPGPHPEPVDTPALTWLAGSHSTLPATHGFFLDRTHRMHPRVADPVSHLYFDSRLRADSVPHPPEVTLEPGIDTVLVEHHGNTTASDAEAREVLQQIRELLGRNWYDGSETRRLQPHDIVVVSPHRAQVSLIRTLLSRARIDEVLVGTPELFRGREAAVVLISPATSGPDDAPVPVGTLLSSALVHDALCRARRRAIIVRSPLLTEYLPETPGELVGLSRFIRL